MPAAGIAGGEGFRNTSQTRKTDLREEVTGPTRVIGRGPDHGHEPALSGPPMGST
jgi:hypothetical protein